jgi:hypothetical protein
MALQESYEDMYPEPLIYSKDKNSYDHGIQEEYCLCDLLI